MMKNDAGSTIYINKETNFECLIINSRNRVFHNDVLITKFHFFVKRRTFYAYYIIPKISGSLFVKGSTTVYKNNARNNIHIGKYYFSEVVCLLHNILHQKNYLSLNQTNILTNNNQRIVYFND